MQMIREWIFSIHTKHDINMRLKFTQQMKFVSFSGAREKLWSGGNIGEVNMQV